MCKRLGPGPGAYMLPPTIGYDKHDYRKIRRPMYSFGYRPPILYHNLGPGPGTYKLNRITRFGPDGTPAYSLGQRLNSRRTETIPGPGAHENHLCPLFKERRPPAYSMGIRTNVRCRDNIPGPNNYLYSTDAYKRRVPAFSIGARFKTRNCNQSPGAAAYGVVSRDITNRRSPMYSMTSRTEPISSKTRGPGPNIYNLQPYKPGDNPAQYSFGIRHGDCAPPMIVECDN